MKKNMMKSIRGLAVRMAGTMIGIAATTAAMIVAGHAEAAVNGISVLRYDATVEPVFAGKSITGKVRMEVVTEETGKTELTLDAGGLVIDGVRIDGKAAGFVKKAPRLIIDLPDDRKKGERHEVAIVYHGVPTEGMHFLAESDQVYTEFSTSQWMPCFDAPSERAAFDLTLILPAGVKVVANGDLVSEASRADGKIVSRWSQKRPMPSYLYGFAAGKFREVIDSSGKPVLRYLAPMSFSEQDVRRIFQDTSDMVRFYEGEAGTAYPYAVYTQVLIKGSAAQEMDGFTVMGERYGAKVLGDGSKTWLGAHELSHQWWGNGLTNRAWNEFWLNEGIASFMNAAYFEHRSGRAEYMHYIDAARESYEKVRAAGKDKSLIFPDWDHPTSEDRALVYDKGAYVVHLLREEIGDEAFWKGMREYTTRNWNKPVATEDFQHAMEDAAGRSLSGFFSKWVYRH